MKIAIVSPEFPPDIGGVETYAFEFSRELVRQGHDVVVFTRRHAEGEINVPGLEVIPGLSHAQDLDSQLFATRQADVWHALNAGYAWIALTGRPTVVTVHGNDFLDAYIPCAPFSLERLPLVWRLAGRLNPLLMPIWLRRGHNLLPRAFAASRHILSNSCYTEKVFLERFPACRGKTTVAYVGVSERFFSIPRAPRSGGPIRLLTVCRLSEPRKNVAVVLDALGRLRERYDFEYVVAGDGHLRDALARQAERLGLGDRVRFAGRVSDAELTALYAAADLFVLTASIVPGSHEGFGIVYLEAAASGLPSLAARLAGAAEAVGEGESGFFVESPDVESLCQALDHFMSGSIHFQPEACRAFARRFTWTTVASAALDAYRNVLSVA